MPSSDTLAWQLTELNKIVKDPILIIATHNRELELLAQKLRFFQPSIAIFSFPEWETLIYDRISPSKEIVVKRLTSLAHIQQLSHGIIITTLTAISQYLAPQNYINTYCFQFRQHQTLDISQLEVQLAQSGYQRVLNVKLAGQFSIRGSSMDIFPLNSARPFRLDMNINQIENIWYFDPKSQLVQEACENIHILPSREFPLSSDSVKQFQEKALSLFGEQFKKTTIYQRLSLTSYPAGIEYYLPLFFSNTKTLLDYIPNNTQWISIQDLAPLLEPTWEQMQHRYQEYNFDTLWPVLPPEKLYQLPQLLKQSLSQFKKIELERIHKNPIFHEESTLTLAVEPLSTVKPTTPYTAHKSLDLLKQWIESFISNAGTKILFCIERPSQQETLLQHLSQIDYFPKMIENWESFLHSKELLHIAISPIKKDFKIRYKNLVLLSYSSLLSFINPQVTSPIKASSNTPANQLNAFNDLTQLAIESPIVHIDHGIGIYLGLETLMIGENPAEFIVLGYANNTKLYVPITEIHQLSPYHGSQNPTLNSLGSEQWQKTKNKVITQLKDTAAELLDIYARKAQSKGCNFSVPDQEYVKFENSFLFEETVDQKKAIEEVIADLCQEQPMDRVICGDVGFGKTEVAMRAAFLAVQSHKQVAVLAPTTLLVEQHYRNFRDRFADWPITVDWISRFRTTQENQQVKKKLANQAIDIIIGTHSLLSKTIQFQDLGLLIIDEEHHFGVQQKEKLLQLKTEINVLTLTATPIPRTLQSALSGLRSLSIIATPPVGRLPIQSFITPRKSELIREAILRELSRGGQIYLVHNRVEHLERIKREITALVPEAQILIVHGQLKEHELEERMSLFYQQQFNLLICTSIIETGLDIANANTLIVDQADHFGLAQLHQLRGRVGRSHHQAYAYFLVPEENLLTPNAKKRLAALRSLTHLGSGFTLASHDLDIRGAGELLGDKQSGLIQGIGFSLYMELLEETIQNMQKDTSNTESLLYDKDINIELHIPILIPENYIPNVSIRLQYYNQIAKTKHQSDLKQIELELTDRYGMLPQTTKNLFAITQLKWMARTLGIQTLKATVQSGWCEFIQTPQINPFTIIQLVQAKPHLFKLVHNPENQKQKLHFTWPNVLRSEQLIPEIQAFLSQLS